jgi:hypothetical protein
VLVTKGLKPSDAAIQHLRICRGALSSSLDEIGVVKNVIHNRQPVMWSSESAAVVANSSYPRREKNTIEMSRNTARPRGSK